ncbi:MAG: hypothetical protein K2O15_01550, partial [Lachnospiraceae bacterium]|nr:hypothetical protein [Lachnospiraceae bacterium]
YFMYALCYTMSTISPQSKWRHGFRSGTGNQKSLFDKKGKRVIYLRIDHFPAADRITDHTRQSLPDKRGVCCLGGKIPASR